MAKKRLFTFLLALCMTLPLFTCAFAETVDQTSAENTALADAGISRDQAERLRSTTDTEQGVAVYDVSFVYNGREYDYEVRISDGAVLKRGYEPTAEASLALAQAQAGSAAYIAEADARQKALAAAGLDAGSITASYARLHLEDGVKVYEVTLYTDAGAWEFDLDAVTGEIVAEEAELFAADRSERQASEAAAAGMQASTDTGLEAAKAAALADAGVSSGDVTFTRAKTDWDDGIKVYEVEFVTGDTEYEYEISASSGAILSRETEARRTGSSTASAGTGSMGSTESATSIGVDRAKQIALSHAGLSTGDVTFTKAKLENDDGRREYEIDFYRNGVSYEYDIDAATGAILSYDKEQESRDDDRDDDRYDRDDDDDRDDDRYDRDDDDDDDRYDRDDDDDDRYDRDDRDDDDDDDD